jgi:hypothetical protein
MTYLRKLAFASLLAALVSLGAAPHSNWRQATEAELKDMIPARAPVEKERIETEFRTASGITDGKANIYGVVLITAGYSADGKYSHYFVTQVPLIVGELLLKPGSYVFGWQKDVDSLSVKFYEAQSGKYRGAVEAARNSRIGKIESFHIFAPSERSAVQIGRFAFPYRFVR